MSRRRFKLKNTETLIKTEELRGVQVLDRVIVSHGGSQSIRESQSEMDLNG